MNKALKKICSEKELINIIPNIKTKQTYYINIPETNFLKISTIFKDKNITYDRIDFKTWTLTPLSSIEKNGLIYSRLITLIISVLSFGYMGYKIVQISLNVFSKTENFLTTHPLITEIIGVGIIGGAIPALIRYIAKKNFSISIRDYLNISSYNKILRKK